VVVHLQDTIQTLIVAPITDIKDNLDRLADNLHDLHSKVDSIENTLDMRFTTLDTHNQLRSAQDYSVSVDVKSADKADDASDSNAWSTPIELINKNNTATSSKPVVIPASPYGSPYFSNRGARAAPTSTSRYPVPSALCTSSGGVHRSTPGTANSYHELTGSGPVNWMNSSKGPYLDGVQKTFKTISISLVSDGFDDFFRFYNGIITQLSLAGYHRCLLPSLEYIAPDVDYVAPLLMPLACHLEEIIVSLNGRNQLTWMSKMIISRNCFT
jgi:hypothetical protein